MSIKFDQNHYFYCFKEQNKIDTDESLINFIKKTAPMTSHAVSRRDYYAGYDIKGWGARKFKAIPKALWFGTVLTTYHLFKAIFIGLPKVYSGNRLYAKAYFYSAGRDLQGAYGAFATIFNDRYGSFYVEESLFYNSCYKLLTGPSTEIDTQTEPAPTNPDQSLPPNFTPPVPSTDPEDPFSPVVSAVDEKIDEKNEAESFSSIADTEPAPTNLDQSPPPNFTPPVPSTDPEDPFSPVVSAVDEKIDEKNEAESFYSIADYEKASEEEKEKMLKSLDIKREKPFSDVPFSVDELIENIKELDLIECFDLNEFLEPWEDSIFKTATLTDEELSNFKVVDIKSELNCNFIKILRKKIDLTTKKILERFPTEQELNDLKKINTEKDIPLKYINLIKFPYKKETDYRFFFFIKNEQLDGFKFSDLKRNQINAIFYELEEDEIKKRIKKFNTDDLVLLIHKELKFIKKNMIEEKITINDGIQNTLPYLDDEVLKKLDVSLFPSRELFLKLSSAVFFKDKQKMALLNHFHFKKAFQEGIINLWDLAYFSRIQLQSIEEDLQKINFDEINEETFHEIFPSFTIEKLKENHTDKTEQELQEMINQQEEDNDFLWSLLTPEQQKKLKPFLRVEKLEIK